MGVAFHHLDSAFINAHIVKLLQTWISWKPFSIYLNLLALQFLESSKFIMLLDSYMIERNNPKEL